MLRLLTGFFCLIIGSPLLAQVNITTSSAANNLNISDPNGTLYKEVGGSPYFPSDVFYPGKMTNGTVIADRIVRFNMASGLPEYMEGKTVLTPSTSINNVSIFQPNGEPLLFRNGFPAVDKQNLLTFYQVLVDGQQLSLLIFRHSVIKEGKEMMDSDFGKKWFESSERYYVYNAATRAMQGIYSPKAVLNALPEKTAQLKQYASDQKLKLKDWEDAARLVIYANGL